MAVAPDQSSGETGVEPSRVAGSAGPLSPVGILLRGFCMGCADIVPGVSGGTMAYLLGIYARLIDALRHFDSKLVTLLRARNWQVAWQRIDGSFLLLLFVGVLMAVLFVTRVLRLPWLLEHHPDPVFGLFFGLIVGSLALLAWRLGRHLAPDFAALLFGVFCGLGLVNLVPVATPDTPLFMFGAGALAISAMLLPGVSGSYLLLVFGKYQDLLEALGALNVRLLLPFALGCAFGLLAFSRVLGWLLHHFDRATRMVINGVLLGSLVVVWPFQDRRYDLIGDKLRVVERTPILPEAWAVDQYLALGMMVLGVVLVVLIARSAQRLGAHGD